MLNAQIAQTLIDMVGKNNYEAKITLAIDIAFVGDADETIERAPQIGYKLSSKITTDRKLDETVICGLDNRLYFDKITKQFKIVSDPDQLGIY